MNTRGTDWRPVGFLVAFAAVGMVVVQTIIQATRDRNRLEMQVQRSQAECVSTGVNLCPDSEAGVPSTTSRCQGGGS